MNFIHTADMHLGYRQYDLEQRFIDLGITFKEIIEYAVLNKVEFVLISGDLFDKRSINAPTYVQAVHVLSMLKDAGIPCVAIEGNHDRRFMKDGMSWLESLEWEGLLKVIKNYDGNLMGNFVDIGSTRIFGLNFAGSMTSASIMQIAQEIKDINAKSPPVRTIMMMHAGVQGKMKTGIMGEVTYEDLYPLKEAVNYLALGHYHIAYDIDGWVYNPGCPDTCSISEVGEPKGFYHVKDGSVKLVVPNIRKFIVLRISVDEHKGVDTLLKNIEERLSKIEEYDSPVVNVILDGTLNFDKSHLDIDAIKKMVGERLNALYVDVRFDLLNDEFGISRLDTEGFDRSGIEREVFRKLARSDSILAGKSELFAASLTEVKNLAVKGADELTLDSIMRRIYNDIKDEKPAPVTVTIETLQPDVSEKPVKKPRKKAPVKGQVALDWGNSP
jgi:DNA repair protein SbcD/Mre11